MTLRNRLSQPIAIDRPSSDPSSMITITATTGCGGDNNERLSGPPPVAVLATSVSSSSSSPPPAPTKDVVSLQAKLLRARQKNELLRELERGTDADGNPLGQYRKRYFDHLKGKALAISTVRVALTQGVTIVASFITEQLELDLERNKKVDHGELTQHEADLEADAWEKIEWHRRWKTFPRKFLIALSKFHAVTLILRSYEYLAATIVNLKQLDKLTMDPFAMSKRIARKLEDKKPTDTPAKGSRQEKLEVTISMTQATLWANFLPFFADFSLHQGLLCYGCYKYYGYKRQKRIAAHAAISPADPDEQDDSEKALEDASKADKTELVQKLGHASSKLATNRGLGWISSSVGAGIGSVIWPGWGTIVVSALGDSVAGMVLDDGYGKFRKELDDQQREEEARETVRKATIQ